MIANEYGNVDIRDGVPAGWIHIRGNNANGEIIGCDCLEHMEHYSAMVGFAQQEASSHSRHGIGFSKPSCWRPRFDGIVVREHDAVLVRREMESFKTQY